MAKESVPPVGPAFEALLEAVHTAMNRVNEAGATAFAGSDYAGVDTARQQTRRLSAFHEKVADLQKEWRELVTALEEEAGTDDKVKRRKRDLGRVKRGTKTPQVVFRIPILSALVAMGGSGATADVLDKVQEGMRHGLTEVDHEPLPSNANMPRWRNTAQWARHDLVNEGLMRGDSPRGIWEISEAGRAYLLSAGSGS
jgi:restriction system protein